MKIKVNFQKVSIALAILSAVVVVFTSFYGEPDILFFKINGYKFGINWTTNTHLKITCFFLCFLAGMSYELANEEDSKQA